MGLIDDLIGGKKHEPQENNTYNVYIQFDEDKPLILFDNIEQEDSVTLVFDNTHEGHMNIKCPKTGKQIKIFSKNNDE